jgi:hypothetical protein
MKKTAIYIMLSIMLATTFTSCMVTKTNVGTFKEEQGKDYVYAKGKQVWFLWGLIPIGRTNVSTPADGSCQVITKYNFGDLLIFGLTAGVFKSYTIKIKAKQTSASLSEQAKQFTTDFKVGDSVIVKSSGKIYEGEVIGLKEKKCVVKYLNNSGYKVIKEIWFEDLTKIKKD